MILVGIKFGNQTTFLIFLTLRNNLLISSGAIVVPELSATLGFGGEVKVSFDGDHSKIVKYGSEQDNN